jgi:nicotinamidase-related amidase
LHHARISGVNRPDKTDRWSGAETDVCVLAAVLDAVDLGYRVVLARDALCSASDRTHDALLTLYRERFGQQIEVASANTILANWS